VDDMLVKRILPENSAMWLLDFALFTNISSTYTSIFLSKPWGSTEWSSIRPSVPSGVVRDFFGIYGFPMRDRSKSWEGINYLGNATPEEHKAITVPNQEGHCS
jgi:hypothetical protein